jgi:ADP-ribosylglycohydrolase
MPGWATLEQLLREEITQRSEEGCDIAGVAERCEGARNADELMKIYYDLQKLRVRSDFPYVEPSHLAGIRAARAGITKRWNVKLDDALFDRIHGAWLGRIAGCMLGKPVEGWPKEVLEKYLKAIGEYPLSNYVPPAGDALPEGVERSPHEWSARGNWKHALTDDDTNYTVIGLKIMEEKGVDFTTGDVGHMWLQNLPYNHVCTAERQAYMNLVNQLPIEQVPMYLNPYREWIGAQIRADFWGYAAPGWPEKAAEFAYRDAAVSHIKNGIYGEMFCAAAISAALATDDVSEIIEAAANEIPAKCRLAETIADCLRWRKECSTWEQAFAKMLDTYYGKYSWVHTNNNLAIVLIAMLFGWPDFEKVITISVMQGMDSDCNGATAGSIIGAALGAKALPAKWIDPLGGKLETTVIGFPLPEIEELARRTMKQVEKVLG